MKLTHLIRTCLVGVALLVISSCHSGPTDEEVCTAVAQSYCNLVNRCAPASIVQLYGDVPSCVARQQLGCNNFFPPDSVTTTTDLQTCADALGAASCDEGINIAECRPKAGARSNGMLCSADNQCQSAFCDKGGNTTTPCGVCGARAKLGEPCDVTTCDFDLLCSFANAQPHCVMPTIVQLGGDCTGGDKKCQAGLGCIAGKCTTLLKAGDTCTFLASACDPSMALYCDATSMKCVATQFVGSGQACGNATPMVRTQCRAGGGCLNQGLQSFCVGAPSEGQRCSGGTYSCVPPASCVNGLCTLPDPLFCK